MDRPPKEVIDGLRTLATCASAGGPEDIGLSEDDDNGWSNVLAAIGWVRAIPPRDKTITMSFTRSELAALWRMADNSWSSGEWVTDYLKGDKREQLAASNAYGKLTIAHQQQRKA